MRLKIFWSGASLNAIRWVAYALFALCQLGAVFLSGGVYGSQWIWIGMAVALAALLANAARLRESPADESFPELLLLGALLGWFVLQLIPFPPVIIQLLSPGRWQAAQAARLALGVGLQTPLAFSVAPAASFARLLCVLPAIAAFLAAREAGLWWKGNKLWLLATPLIVAAFLESVLGMLQNAIAQQPAHGTYVNRDHFAGLLEMALPLTVAWASALWWKSHHKHDRHAQNENQDSSAGRTGGTILLAVAAACIFRTLILSESRMGFFAGVIALALVGAGFLAILRRQRGSDSAGWVSPIPVVAVLLMAGFASTSALLMRVADTASPADRLAMWRATFPLVRNYPLFGVGLGAYEHAFYQYQNFMPGFTIDYAHNDYLQILAELGLGGALIVLLLAGVIVWRLFSALRHPHPEHWPLALGIFGALSAIALHSFVDFNLYIPANALAVAWLAGLAVSPTLSKQTAAQAAGNAERLMEDPQEYDQPDVAVEQAVAAAAGKVN